MTRNLRTAERLADRLLRLDVVRGIELFGSVARYGNGRDIDLIVNVDEEVANRFIDLVGRYGYSYRAKPIRFKTAEMLLIPELAVACLEWGLTPTLLDIFLFPDNWRERLIELQTRLPNRDPYFMRNIASDARVYNPRLGVFRAVPVGSR